MATSGVFLEFLPPPPCLRSGRNKGGGQKPKGGEKIWKMLGFGPKIWKMLDQNPKKNRAPSARDFFLHVSIFFSKILNPDLARSQKQGG